MVKAREDEPHTTLQITQQQNETRNKLKPQTPHLKQTSKAIIRLAAAATQMSMFWLLSESKWFVIDTRSDSSVRSDSVFENN